MDSFLETSALIDLTYKDKATQNKVRACISDKTITSRYVIFELSRGYLRNLILLHNKAVSYTKFSELYAYLSNIRRKAYLAGTITEAFKKYFEEGMRLGQIEKIPNVTDDELILRHFTPWLRKQIRYNWQKIERSVDGIINSVGCKPAIASPKLDDDNLFQHDLKTDKCGLASECGIRSFVEVNRAAFESIRDYLIANAEKDKETETRIKSLKELYRKRGNFIKTDCYYSGDAIIVFECPSNTKVISKNRKHIEDICTALGKTGEFYR